MIEFDDDTPMPFGKFQGIELADVPDDYLLWLYNRGLSHRQLRQYIELNLDAIKANVSDLNQKRVGKWSKTDIPPFRQ